MLTVRQTDVCDTATVPVAMTYRANRLRRPRRIAGRPGKERRRLAGRCYRDKPAAAMLSADTSASIACGLASGPNPFPPVG